MIPDATRTAAARVAADRLADSPPRPWLAFFGLTLCSALAASLVAVTNGNLLIVPVACAALLFLVLLVRRLEFGVYVLLAAALLLDQFEVLGIPSAISSQAIRFYMNLNSSTGVGGLVFNPVEFLLVLLLAIWLVRAAISREWYLHRIPNIGIAILFLMMLVFFTAYGLLRPNGNWKAALWEIRSLYYLCAMYFLATQLIRTPRQVRICVWIVIVGLALRGLQGSWRYFITLHRDLGKLRAILGHEDSLFLVTGFVLLAALFFLHYCGRERTVLLCALPFNLIAFIFNQRRVTFGVLMLCLALVVALLPKAQLRLALRYVIPGVFLLAMYTMVFWNSTGTLALPAQKIKSVFVQQEGTADEGSNEWRKMELVNLKATVRAYPQGVGFGQKYLVLFPYPDIGAFFQLWEYIPHCAIYWIWCKTGFAGFAVFWLFFGVAIVQAVIDYRAMRDPYYKAVALTVMLFIVGQLIVSYYDLQLTYYRNMLYLGIAMALGVVVRRLDSSAGSGEPHVQ